MVFQPEEPAQGGGGVDRLSYNPMHDYRRIDPDAWAEQWFSGFAELGPDSEEYHSIGQIAARQLHLYPDYRQIDAADVQAGMDILRMFGMPNPHDAESESAEERQRHQEWKQAVQYAHSLARYIVRATLEDAHTYATLRVEREYAGIDHLSGIANRRGMLRLLKEQYGVDDSPTRHGRSGEPLPPVRLVYAYADINKFRWFNSKLGHQVGDAAIVETAWGGKEFWGQLRMPILFRDGGDEFGSILGGLSEADAMRLKEQVYDEEMRKVKDPGSGYLQSTTKVEQTIQALKASGQPVRAEARRMRLTPDESGSQGGTYHMLYINGQPITELRNLISFSVGVSMGDVSNLADIERLRQAAEADMGQVKQALHEAMEGR